MKDLSKLDFDAIAIPAAKADRTEPPVVGETYEQIPLKRLYTEDDLPPEDVMDTIHSLEKTSPLHPAIVYQADLYPKLLITGVLLLAIAFLLRHTLLREIS